MKLVLSPYLLKVMKTPMHFWSSQSNDSFDIWKKCLFIIHMIVSCFCRAELTVWNNRDVIMNWDFSCFRKSTQELSEVSNVCYFSSWKLKVMLFQWNHHKTLMEHLTSLELGTKSNFEPVVPYLIFWSFLDISSDANRHICFPVVL